MPPPRDERDQVFVTQVMRVSQLLDEIEKDMELLDIHITSWRKSD